MTLDPLLFLDSATPEQIKALSPEQLQILKNFLGKESARHKRRKDTLDAGLKLKYLEAATRALHAIQRDTGTTRIKDGEYVVVAELKKKVAWDQTLLIPVVEKLPPTVKLPGLSMAYSIHETHYKTWNPSIQALFVPARTVSIGPCTFDFKKETLV